MNIKKTLHRAFVVSILEARNIAIIYSADYAVGEKN